MRYFQLSDFCSCLTLATHLGESEYMQLKHPTLTYLVTEVVESSHCLDLDLNDQNTRRNF